MNIMGFTGKVWMNKGNKQKLVTIPKCSDILPGDRVRIERVEESECIEQ